MIPWNRCFHNHLLSILHVCGDDPSILVERNYHLLYSPRMWRWSLLKAWDKWKDFRILHVCGDDPELLSSNLLLIGVFSTYVEMILQGFTYPWLWNCILHVCGDDPLPRILYGFHSLYSPRMWRWSQKKTRKALVTLVFSTYVEMILSTTLKLKFHFCILHVCGDDPFLIRFCQTMMRYSPRMWRWSSSICK